MHLRAQMPSVRISTRGMMELRIARKVAALCGIPGPPDSSDDAGVGRAWLSDFRALTTTEIALGGPLVADSPNDSTADAGAFRRDGRRFVHTDGPQIDPMRIPNVALNDYGPDTKAALVLAGVNRVLRPVTDAVLKAMSDIRHQIDDPRLLVAVGHCLLQEVFEAQPILVLNGIQAAIVQRTLSLLGSVPPSHQPGSDPATPIARTEYGRPRATWPHQPVYVDVIYQLWDSLVAPGRLYDETGMLAGRDDEPYVRTEPMSGFEQDELISSTGQAEMRDRLVAYLRYSSEAQLAGTLPGAPRCTTVIFRPRDDVPFAEVVVPRQRQAEVMLASLADRLGPLRPGQPIPTGRPLKLPELSIDAWSHRPILQRRAVLLAHYYTLRAAGWISGMVDLQRGRSRDECALRCAGLVRGASALLAEDDPLREQLTIFGMGYQLQYHAANGSVTDIYWSLRELLNAALERASRDQLGKAQVAELLQLVLRDLRTVRSAAAAHVINEPTQEQLNGDMSKWWNDARSLRDQLVFDERERVYLDHSYAAFLASAGSTDDDVLEGLSLFTNTITPQREKAAEREGRWRSLRFSYQQNLRGLTVALQRRIDEQFVVDWAQQACTIAVRLRDHPVTTAYLAKLTQPRMDGRPLSYDGGVITLLLTIAEGLVAAVITSPEVSWAADRASVAVEELNRYVDTIETQQLSQPVRVPQLLRQKTSDITEQWRCWCRRSDGSDGAPAVIDAAR